MEIYFRVQGARTDLEPSASLREVGQGARTELLTNSSKVDAAQSAAELSVSLLQICRTLFLTTRHHVGLGGGLEHPLQSSPKHCALGLVQMPSTSGDGI